MVGLVDAVRDCFETRQAEIEQQRLTFLRTGIALIRPEREHVCPFCGHETISKEVFARINHEIQRGSAGSEARSRLVAAADSCARTVSNAINLMRRVSRPRCPQRTGRSLERSSQVNWIH